MKCNYCGELKKGYMAVCPECYFAFKRGEYAFVKRCKDAKSIKQVRRIIKEEYGE